MRVDNEVLPRMRADGSTAAFSTAYSFRGYVISHEDITPFPLLNDKLDYVCRVTANYSSAIRELFDFVRVRTSALRGTEKCGHEVIYHREKPRRNNIYRVVVFVVVVALSFLSILREHTRGTRSSRASRSCIIKRAPLIQMFLDSKKIIPTFYN